MVFWGSAFASGGDEEGDRETRVGEGVLQQA